MLAGLLFRIPFGGGGILLSDLLLPLFAGLWILKKFFWDRTWPSSYLWFPGIAFTIWALFTWVIGAYNLDMTAKILSLAYLVRFFSILILAISVVDLFANKRFKNLDLGKQYSSFFNRLFMIIAAIVALGFLQFYIIPDISMFSTAGGFDPHMGRLLGTWMDPNFVAGLLAFFIPLMIGYFYGMEQRRGKIYLGILILCCLYAGFLTFSRSGYLAMGLGLGIFFLFRDPKIILLGVLVASLGVASNERAQQRVGALTGTLKAVILSDTDEVDVTAKLRVESWQNTMRLWEKYPVMGVGYNTYRYRGAEEGVVDEHYFSAGGSDSTLLTVLVTTGVIGFVLFLGFYVRIWWWNWRQYWLKKEAEVKRRKTLLIAPEVYLGFVAGWSGIFLHCVFVNSLLFPLIFMPMLVVAGVLEQVVKKQF